jgi:iron complex transport system ATP-binding protein
MSMLAVEHLTLAHPGKTLLRDLSIEFQPGECWAVLGSNGSGKTTLLHTLANLRVAQMGTIKLGEKSIADYPRRALAQRIGLLLQEERNEFHGSVREYVELGLFSQGTWLSANTGAASQAYAAMIRMDVASQADRPWNQLSGGERQRARLAQLLAQAPEIYLLDEPLLHLDLRHQLAVLQCLRGLAHEQRKTVIMVLHDSLWASRFCDHALMLYDDGNGRSGAAQTLITKNNLAELYSCSMDSFEFSLPT